MQITEQHHNAANDIIELIAAKLGNNTTVRNNC